MFLPSSVSENQKKEEERRSAFRDIEGWSLEIIPQAIRDEAQVSIQEVQCGDPTCAPIDTAITIQFNRYGRVFVVVVVSGGVYIMFMWRDVFVCYLCRNDALTHTFSSIPSFRLVSSRLVHIHHNLMIFSQWLSGYYWFTDGGQGSHEGRAVQ
jgi:hypothetical protein